MQSSLKNKLSLYGLISAISFIYLIFTAKAGISAPIFILVQFMFIFYITTNKEEVRNNKGILMFIPIFVLSLNYYLSGSNIWNFLNFILIIILYSTMILIMNNKLFVNSSNIQFIIEILINVFRPFKYYILPFKWYLISKNDEIKKALLKRSLLGVLISIPAVLFLLIMLSSADMVFAYKLNFLFIWFNGILNMTYVFKILISIFVGLYLFGLLYIIFDIRYNTNRQVSDESISILAAKKILVGDLIIQNILLCSVLVLYTFFIGIQFKYLFAGSGELPNQLTYAQYARNGFFELIFLSFLNVSLILATIYLLKDKIYNKHNKWSKITKVLMLYLCILTFILLVSSFYRMNLYNKEYGFTRLRVLVYGFLIFEGLGLFITFYYILKPRFNIILIYSVIGLCYYLVVNLCNMDHIIAKKNIDMYLDGQMQTIDINYLTNLSTDAAPEIYRLMDNDDIRIRYRASKYFKNIEKQYNSYQLNWQSNNLSVNRALKLIK